MAKNDFDRIFRENIGAIFMPIVERCLQVEIVERKVLPTKLTGTFEREVDHLFEILAKDGKRFLLHFEFQTQNDSMMLRRIVLYHGHLYYKYGLPIKHFVIYLGAKPPRMRTRLEVDEQMEGFSMLALRSVKLEDTLASSVPEELVLGILNDFGDLDDLEVIRKIIQRLQAISGDEGRLGKYLKQLKILSRIRKLDKLVIEEVEKMPLTINIQEDYLYNRGKAEGKRDTLIELYSQGIITLAKVAEQLETTEAEVLEFVEQWKAGSK